MSARTGEVPGARSRADARRRALIVAQEASRWTDLVAALRGDGIRVDLMSGTVDPADVARNLGQGEDTALIVDLEPDAVHGMTIVAASRRTARLVPVVVAAASPSLDLARRVRLSGAFYLAVHPVSADELRAVLHDAFDSIERKRPDASVCHARERILIVDGDPAFIASTEALLAAEGYSVAAAATIRDALAKVSIEPPDLIVLDVMMEQDKAPTVKFGAGFESMRHIPIVMVSSVPITPPCRPRTAGDLEMLVSDVCLTKPLDTARFLEEIKRLLGEQPDVLAT